MSTAAAPPLVLQPIGHVRSALKSKAEAARQPRAAEGNQGRIELLAGRNFEHALDDLAGWEYLWVIFWLHLNAGWRPKVLPPRSRSGRKGVFATRSPHRPNPLGLSVVRLERIEGLTLHLRNVDMLDGTPVLDLKPYVAYSDALPDARSGWLDDDDTAASGMTPADPVLPWQLEFDDLAAQQAAWIEARTGLALRQRICETLALGPEPHPYRRIRRQANGLQLAVKEWRVRCMVEGRAIRVLEIASGYRASQLTAVLPAEEPFRAHREFKSTFGIATPDQSPS
jgi:tRNA-Thr(GGU) m(6)t(6)A37 methyltransferase TsaA